MRAFTVALLTIVGCTSAQTAPPTLEVTTPARGAVSGSDEITVTGTATNADQVTVNGIAVTPDKTGAFSAAIQLQAGIGIIETHAISGGDDVRDVRAVLTGALAPTDGSVKAPVGAFATVAALKSIGNAMATDAKAIDYTAAVQPLNPVYDNGGCLGATINITNVALGDVKVGLAPAAGSLGTTVTIDDVVVTLHASFKVACIGGSTTITLKASAAHLTGGLAVKVSQGKLETSIGDVSVVLDGFSLDVGSVPGAIANLFDSTVRGKVESALTSVIHDKVPAIANKALAGLVAKPVAASILGKSTTLGIVPSAVTVSATGVYVAMESTIEVDGGDGAMVLSQPVAMTADLIDHAHGVGLAVANDAVDQLFGGLWAAGAFEKSLPIASVGPLAAILDPAATTLDIQLSLPPTVTTDLSGLELAVGDLIVTTHDDTNTVIQQIAVSLQTSLTTAAGTDNKLALAVGAPTVHAQVIAQAASVARPLTDSEVESIVTSVWGIVGSSANEALGKLPMPAFGGIHLGAPAISGVAGYVVADIALQ